MDAKGLAEWDKNKEHNVHNQGHSAPAAAQEQPAQDLPRSLSTAKQQTSLQQVKYRRIRQTYKNLCVFCCFAFCSFVSCMILRNFIVFCIRWNKFKVQNYVYKQEIETKQS